ncbi:hypothetical protein Tco_1122134 [Tanacetum coccineum]|uniref:Uncharacterized protein n=1 Tax=Tanacetum coccineum TaxID=301880 RepID=A0ABQ5IZV4_9ASTR
MPLITVPVVMKHVQSMLSSVTPVRRYGNPPSGYESYMLAVHSETGRTQPNRNARATGNEGHPDADIRAVSL